MSQPPSAPVPPVGWSLVREVGPWILVAAVLGLFFPVVFAGETLFLRDLYAYFLPQKRLLAELVGQGQLPLYNPWLHGGQPYLASLGNAALYPPNLVYLVLPVVLAFNLSIVAHLAAGGLFAYALGRHLGLGQAAALIGAVVFTFAGVTLSLVNVLNLLLATVWIPLLLLLWDRVLDGAGRRWAVAVAVVAAVQLLAGAPEITLASFLLLALWTVARARGRGELWRHLGRWGVLAAVVAGLTAVQLLPTLELVLQSSRGRSLSVAAITTWSLHPVRLLELVLPGLFGLVDTLRDTDYWGLRRVDGGFPYLLSVYQGWVVLTLALTGGLVGTASTGPAARLRRVLLGVAVGAPVLALGRHLPGLESLIGLVPGAGLFRFPSKVLVAGLVPTALLAGVGAERVLGGAGVARRWWLAAWAGAAAMAAGVGALHLRPSLASRVVESLFLQPGHELATAGVVAAMAHATVVWVGFCLLLTVVRRRPARWPMWGLAALVAVDLIAAGAHLNPSTEPEAVTEAGPLAELVRAELDGGRLFRDSSPTRVVLAAPSNDVLWRYRYNLEVLDSDLAAAVGLPVIFHEDLIHLAPVALEELRRAILAAPWERRRPLLAAGGVSVVVTADEVEVDGLERLAVVPTRARSPLFVLRHGAAAPPVGVVSAATAVGSSAEALAAMLEPGFDPRRQVVVQAPAAALEVDPGCSPRIETAADEVTRVTAEVDAPCPSWLVLTRPLAPGWRARVDGVGARVERANLAFMAVAVAPGRHRVELVYRPVSLVLGAAVSLLSALALAAVVVVGPPRSHRPSRQLPQASASPTSPSTA